MRPTTLFKCFLIWNCPQRLRGTERDEKNCEGGEAKPSSRYPTCITLKVICIFLLNIWRETIFLSCFVKCQFILHLQHFSLFLNTSTQCWDFPPCTCWPLHPDVPEQNKALCIKVNDITIVTGHTVVLKETGHMLCVRRESERSVCVCVCVARCDHSSDCDLTQEADLCCSSGDPPTKLCCLSSVITPAITNKNLPSLFLPHHRTETGPFLPPKKKKRNIYILYIYTNTFFQVIIILF